MLLCAERFACAILRGGLTERLQLSEESPQISNIQPVNEQRKNKYKKEKHLGVHNALRGLPLGEVRKSWSLGKTLSTRARTPYCTAYDFVLQHNKPIKAVRCSKFEGTRSQATDIKHDIRVDRTRDHCDLTVSGRSEDGYTLTSLSSHKSERWTNIQAA